MSLFGPFQFTMLMHPWFLALLPAVLVLLLAEVAARAPGVLQVSTGETLAKLQGHGRAALRRLPPLLRALGLVLLVLALARPVRGLEARTDRANVIDIMLCVDVSGSMKAMDYSSSGRNQNRLDDTKQAVHDFILNRKDKSEDRFGRDRLGLVCYAGYAWTQCPLTLDYAVLEHELERVEIDETDRRKQGTAIGSALGLAVAKLNKSEAKTKIIILLTDGINNKGELDPITAAKLAKEYNIRVYTIGAGSGGEVLVPQTTPFGPMYVQARMPIDEEMLKRIADATGGKFYRAQDVEKLNEAYAEINRLEKTEVKVDDYYDYEEGFVPYAVTGMVALFASLFARRYWFDPIP
ncbi:MAG: VWA domain-containing protein [FCB group bacterium]|jgi:Ca-activated chloride channel family protein|nr:VWA domain-containing protein [FCB group bacterium]